jgi:hypothetical protein
VKRSNDPLEALPALKVRTGMHYQMTRLMGDLLPALLFFCDSGVETLPECGENPNEQTTKVKPV